VALAIVCFQPCVMLLAGMPSKNRVVNNENH
jgi:hypothetical protein